MATWTGALKAACISGSIASVASMAMLALHGWRVRRRPADPVNAVSHWVWGDAAIGQREPSLRHTVPGMLIHHGASIFWALFYEKLCARSSACPPLAERLGNAALITTAAYVVDFRLTPRRLTPGFEHRLSRPALWSVYAAFAAALAAGAWLHHAARRGHGAPADQEPGMTSRGPLTRRLRS